MNFKQAIQNYYQLYFKMSDNGNVVLEKRKLRVFNFYQSFILLIIIPNIIHKFHLYQTSMGWIFIPLGLIIWHILCLMSFYLFFKDSF